MSQHQREPVVQEQGNVPLLDARAGLWTHSWRPYIVIAFLVLLVHGRTIFFDLTNCDDDFLVVDQYSLHHDLANVPRAFQIPYFDYYYRPLVDVSFIIDAQFSNTSPAGYHLTNVVLHVIVCCLLFFLLTRLIDNRMLDLMSVLAFCVLPIASQAVAWIPGRNDLLASVFILASFAMFIQFVRSEKTGYGIAHLAFFLAALCSKEISLVLPAACLLYVALFQRRKELIRPVTVLGCGWIASLAGWYLLRSGAMKGGHMTYNAYLSDGALAKLPAVIELFGKTFIPVNLSAYPTFSTVSTVVGSVALLTFLVIAARARDVNRNILILGIAWFLLFLIPSFAVQIQNEAQRFNYLESRAYTSLAGLAFVSAELVRAAQVKSRRLFQLFGAVIAVFSLITFVYESNYQNALNLWTHAAASSPNAAVPRFKLGELYERDNRLLDKAIENYARAVKLDPTEVGYLNNLGYALAKHGELEEAKKQFNAAIRLDPLKPVSYFNLGSAYFLDGEQSQAEQFWNKAIELKPDFAEPRERLLKLHFDQHRFAEALEDADRLQQQGVAVDPSILAGLQPYRK